MSKKHRESFIALWLLAATLLIISASAQEIQKASPEQAPATPKTAVNAALTDQDFLYKGVDDKGNP